MKTEGQLAVLRVAGWKFALPLAPITQVLSAAMPIKLPQGDGASFVVRLGERLVPVVFGASLFGGEEVELRLEDKMIVLRVADGELVLWVDAMEDVVPFVPLDTPPEGLGNLPHVACFSGGLDTLPVMDLSTFLPLPRGGEGRGEGSSISVAEGEC